MSMFKSKNFKYQRIGNQSVIGTDICRECGKSFLTVPYISGRTHSLCSEECQNKRIESQLKNLFTAIGYKRH